MSIREGTIWEHLEELRKRLIKVVIAFIVGFVLSWLPAPEFNPGTDIYRIFLLGSYKPMGIWIFDQFILGILPEKLRVMFQSPLSPLETAVTMAFIIATIIALPVLLYEVYQYVRPGLHEHEHRLFKMYFLGSGTLFIIGLFFGYFIIFKALLLLYETWLGMYGSPDKVLPIFTVRDLINNLIGSTIAAGLLFQTPIVMSILTHLELVNPKSYVENRIAVYPIALIIICILTPDPTILTSSIWFCTFVALYEIGIVLSKAIYKKYVLNYRKLSEQKVK